MASPSDVSASALRVIAAEAKIAALKALLEASNAPPTPAPDSATRASLAEARVAALEAELAARANPTPKSASALRVEQAEARVAELQALLNNPRVNEKREEVAEPEVTVMPPVAQYGKPQTPHKPKPTKHEPSEPAANLPAPKVMLDTNGKPMCFSYLRKGKCKNGDACWYSHADLPGNKRVTFADKAHKPACAYYSKPGGCKKGDSCEFAHEDGNADQKREKPLTAKSPGKPKNPRKSNAPAKSESVLRAEAAEAEVAALKAALREAQGGSRNKGVCKYFKAGSCNNGDACAFEHAVESEPQKKMKREQDVEEARRQFELIQQEMRTNVKKVEEEVTSKYAQSNTLDLVIVMDCTASMGDWIEAAKTSIITIIDNVKSDHPCAKVRVGFVAYRDFCDKENRLQIYPLTDEIDSVRSFIATCKAFGGGDEPEDLAGALQEAIKMKFDAEGKRVIVVTDAPCHGNKYHDTRDDQTYGQEIKNSPDVCGQMKTLARRGIDLTFIEVQPERTAKMVDLLESEYKATRPAKGFDPDFLKVELKDAGDVVRFAHIVRSSASSSLMANKARTVIASSKAAAGVSTYHHYGPTGQKGTTLSDIVEGEGDCEEEPTTSVTSAPPKKPLDWNEVLAAPEIPAVRHSFHFRPNEEVNWADLNLKHTTQQTTIRVLPTCFATGAMRSAHAMYDCKIEKFRVAKFYFGAAAATLSASSTSNFSLEDDVEMQIVAKQLATQFSLDPRVDDAVDFIFTCWYEIAHPAAAGLDVAMTKFTAEPYIEGEYYGVGSVFTDPQIHSTEATKFGHGNLSKTGMLAFFSTHECNEVYRSLDLIPLKGQAPAAKSSGAAPTGMSNASGTKPMVCSCPLCGSILTVLRGEFLREHAKGREIYCAECTIKVNKREPRSCNICKKDNPYSPYWYDMKGMEHPTTCKQCKAAGPPIMAFLFM